LEKRAYTAVVAAHRPEVESLLGQIETNPKANLSETVTIMVSSAR